MKKAAPIDFNIDNFIFGMDWMSSQLKLKPGYIVNAKNINLTAFKSLEKRGGCILLYGTTIGTDYVVKKFYEYDAPNGNLYLLVHGYHVTNGGIIRYYTAGWNTVSSGWTSSFPMSCATMNGYCFCAIGGVYSYGSNLVANPNFTTVPDTSWTWQSGWTHDTTNHEADGATPAGNLLQALSISIGTKYRIIFTVKNRTAGDVQPVLGGEYGDAVNYNGTFTQYITTSTTGNFIFSPSVLFVGSIDDVSVSAVSYSGAMLKIYNVTVSNNVGIPAPLHSPACGTGSLTGLTGTYQYVYAYKRSTPTELIGHISDPMGQTVTNQSIQVHCLPSALPEVTHIVLYRTLNYSITGIPSTLYYKVTEFNNVDTYYDDNKPDNQLTVLATNDNIPPPMAKFITVHQNRMIYANCPWETNGKSLWVFSKVNQPEAVPSINYQYFDIEDGDEITGIASLPDALVVFKKNKIAVMSGAMDQWKTISNGIGCIAPYCMVNLGDKVVFLSEEGVKCTDGITVYDIGKSISPLSRAGYLTEAFGINYTGLYYPEKKQLQINLNNSSYNAFVLVGHWLSPLYMEITPEFAQDDIYLGWTYHDYENHVFSAIGTHTDSNGIVRPVAGTSTGYIYQLDTGSADAGYNINMKIETGWYDLGVPHVYTKTLRTLNVTYTAPDVSGAGTVKLYYEPDGNRLTNYITLSDGGDAYTGYAYSNALYYGPDELQIKNIDLNETACGKLFRFRIEDTSTNKFILLSIGGAFRVEGIRDD